MSESWEGGNPFGEASQVGFLGEWWEFLPVTGKWGLLSL